MGHPMFICLAEFLSGPPASSGWMAGGPSLIRFLAHFARLGNSGNRPLCAAHIEGATYLSTFLPGNPEPPEHDPDLKLM